MIRRALDLKGPITAICSLQEVDLSFKSLILLAEDWAVLQDILDLLEIFVRPSCKLQGSTYPTLNYAIPLYYNMLKKLGKVRRERGGSAIGDAATAA
jgi:hypothetical protein